MGVEPTVSVVGYTVIDFVLPVDNVIQLDMEQKADRRAQRSF